MKKGRILGQNINKINSTEDRKFIDNEMCFKSPSPFNAGIESHLARTG